jgi:Skp family chaperone for outer membrane proteins
LKENQAMTSSNPLRHASHAIPVAILSLLLLSAGMCQPAEEAPSVAASDPSDSAEVNEPAAAEAEIVEAGPSPAEIEEQERQAALAMAERELAEREARLAAEEERLRQEQALQAEKERLAAERAAAAERERQLAAREQELRQQEAQIAQREEELAAEERIIIETAPEPLPEPTGSYEGDFDEAWRDSQETADAELETPAPETGDDDSGLLDTEPAPAAVTTASVQAGERFEVQIIETLSSATAREGDKLSARLVHDLHNPAGALVIPAGAEVIGRVTTASPYRRGGGPATLGVEFTDIVISPEQTVGIRASFVELGADRSKNRKKVVAGAVVGAILGHILGGDGSKNVIVGAAAGAAAGGAAVASAKDRDAEIPAGQVLALQLEEVVTVEIEYGAATGR